MRVMSDVRCVMSNVGYGIWDAGCNLHIIKVMCVICMNCVECVHVCVCA